ncbi:MAG: hypothetical protein IPP15_12265 [Saprospiraceae bacterium]|uniref:Uncharacterized protein n=1 Tax=Candidatus Opimibacter skivensis TaxID=2982028 RepID=A0A9D7SWB5_9BACT|nr:hypothetical protein [Candidatus Opimibacter skivensis]
MKTLLSTTHIFPDGPDQYLSPGLFARWHLPGNKGMAKPANLFFDKKDMRSWIRAAKKIGGKKYIAQGMTLKVIYDVNPTTDPKTIDFIIKKVDDDTEITRMVGIYKFVNEKNSYFKSQHHRQNSPTKI